MNFCPVVSNNKWGRSIFLPRPWQLQRLLYYRGYLRLVRSHSTLQNCPNVVSEPLPPNGSTYTVLFLKSFSLFQFYKITCDGIDITICFAVSVKPSSVYPKMAWNVFTLYKRSFIPSHRTCPLHIGKEIFSSIFLVKPQIITSQVLSKLLVRNFGRRLHPWTVSIYTSFLQWFTRTTVAPVSWSPRGSTCKYVVNTISWMLLVEQSHCCLLNNTLLLSVNHFHVLNAHHKQGGSSCAFSQLGLFSGLCCYTMSKPHFLWLCRCFHKLQISHSTSISLYQMLIQILVGLLIEFLKTFLEGNIQVLWVAESFLALLTIKLLHLNCSLYIQHAPTWLKTRSHCRILIIPFIKHGYTLFSGESWKYQYGAAFKYGMILKFLQTGK